MSDKKLDRFIVFEGLDGSGKSTQARMLASHLAAQGTSVHLTAEPTERAIGRLVRQALRRDFSTDSRALALLYAADRSDHLSDPEDGILAHLSRGETVISDRYFYSSLAYQGVSEDEAFLRTINDYPHPETVVFIDTDVRLCLERIDSRGSGRELFEKEDYLRRVRDNFLRILTTLPPSVRLVRVDGAASAEEIFSTILSQING